VQFVFFETTLNPGQFIGQWEKYVRSANSDTDVTLQQSEKNGMFSYIAQHRSDTNSVQFFFEKARRSSRVPEVSIKVKQAGGYSILQLQRNEETRRNEIKLFIFLADHATDLNVYRRLSPQNLNIYESYFENSSYAYILEFFVENKYIENLLALLKVFQPEEIKTYKEFSPVA
jgi:hypothetical protein